MKSDDLIVCETTAAITTHLRVIGDTPPSYTGFAKRPSTLCGAEVGWDTKAPIESARCRSCRAKAFAQGAS